MKNNNRLNVMRILLASLSLTSAAISMEVTKQYDRIIPIGQNDQVCLNEDNLDAVLKGKNTEGSDHVRYTIGARSIYVAKSAIEKLTAEELDLKTLTNDELASLLICAATNFKIQDKTGYYHAENTNKGDDKYTYHFVIENPNVRYIPAQNKLTGYHQGHVVEINTNEIMKAYDNLKLALGDLSLLVNIPVASDNLVAVSKLLESPLGTFLERHNQKMSFVRMTLGKENTPYFLLQKNDKGLYEFPRISCEGGAALNTCKLLQNSLTLDEKKFVENYENYNNFFESPLTLTVVDQNFDATLNDHMWKKQSAFEMPDFVFIRELNLTGLIAGPSQYYGVGDDNKLFANWKYLPFPLDKTVLPAVQLYSKLKEEKHSDLILAGILTPDLLDTGTVYTPVHLSQQKINAILTAADALKQDIPDAVKLPDPKRPGCQYSKKELGIATSITQLVSNSMDAYMTGLCLVFSPERASALLNAIIQGF